MKRYLGIDVGGTYIKYGLLDEHYHVLDKGQAATPRDTMDHLLDSFTALYRLYGGGAAGGEGLSGVGISLTATMDTADEGYCFGGALGNYIAGVRVTPLFQSLFPVPAVVDNDGNCAAMGEYVAGALKECSNGILIGLGTGIAGGIILNGRIYRGRFSCAAEFSYVIADGETGETWADDNGALGLLGELRQLKQDPALDGKAFFRYAHSKDPDALRILDQYVARLTRQIYNLQAILAPDKFVIGGGLSRDPLLMESLYDKLRQFYEVNRGLPQAVVVPSQLGNDANLIGAVFNLRENAQAGQRRNLR